MKVVRDIEDGELHLASTNEGDLSSCSTLQFLVGVSDSNPGSGVRRQRLDVIVTLAVAALALNERERRNQIGASESMRQGREQAGPLAGENLVERGGSDTRTCESTYHNLPSQPHSPLIVKDNKHNNSFFLQSLMSSMSS